MKKILLIASLIALPFTSFAQEVKIGFVNTQEIFSVYPPVKEAQTQLETESKKIEDQLLKMNEEGQKKLEEYQKMAEQPNPDEAILRDKETELQALQMRISNYQKQAREQLQRKQESLMMPINKAVKDAIDAVSAEGGYTYVLDEQVLLFHSSKAENLTSSVRKKLNIPANAQPFTPLTNN